MRLDQGGGAVVEASEDSAVGDVGGRAEQNDPRERRLAQAGRVGREQREDRVIAIELGQMQRAALALAAVRPVHQVDQGRQRLRQQRLHGRVVVVDRDVVADRGEEAAARLDPAAQAIHLRAGQRRHVGQHHDRVVVDLDAGQLVGRGGGEDRAAVGPVARAQRRRQVEELVLVADRARIAVDQEDGDLLAQGRQRVAMVVDRQRVLRRLDHHLGGAGPRRQRGGELLLLRLSRLDGHQAARHHAPLDPERHRAVAHRLVAEVLHLGGDPDTAGAGVGIRRDVHVGHRQVVELLALGRVDDVQPRGALPGPGVLARAQAGGAGQAEQVDRAAGLARAGGELRRAPERRGQVRRPRARLDGADPVAQPQVIAAELGRRLGALGGGDHRDLGLRPQLIEDAAGALARARQE